MERKQYLQLCQMYAVGQDVSVIYDTIQYHPKAYMLDFDKQGNSQHTAILKDRLANSIVYCDLERVKEFLK